MKLGVMKETRPGECRAACTPTIIKALTSAGFACLVQQGAGEGAWFSDEAYRTAGATVVDRETLLRDSDIVAKVQPPSVEEASAMREGTMLVSFLYPTINTDVAAILQQRKVVVLAMDLLPRISRAQSMDALSSQNNLAGYKAVILGANAMPRIFPLLMTSAGTIAPSRVLIFGVGVAGLQAIATAKRLGAVVEATDPRPATREEVESLGGKYLAVEGAEQVVIEGGYAKEVSADYLAKQKALIDKSLAQADLVITTALVMGRNAPILITEEQVKMMKPGAVIVDMAVEQGGNCALSKVNETVTVHGVTIIGQTNLPSLLPQNASELYAKNIQNLLALAAPGGTLNLDMSDEILKGTTWNLS
jgi:NAD(P) transhydrogenase subunit alpha